jgi:hypothetical protein
MRKLLFLLLIISCSQSFSQKRKIYKTIPKVTTKEMIAVNLINDYFKDSKNAWNDIKLLKHDKVDTLYILPYDSKECMKYEIKIKDDPRERDSVENYFSSKMHEAQQNNDDKLYSYYLNKSAKFSSISLQNFKNLLEGFNNAIMNYTTEQKGWEMKCRVLYNSKEQNIEVHFNPELTKITDILSERYAQIYEELRHPNSIEEYKDLLKTYNDRGKLF